MDEDRAMAGAGLARFDADRRLRWANTEFSALFGVPAGAADSCVPLAGVLPGPFADTAGRDGEGIAAELAAGGPVTLRDADGRRFLLSLGEDGEGGHVLTCAPVADGRRRGALRDRQALLETTFEAMADAVCGVDAEMRLMVWNRPYVELFRLPPEIAVPGMPFEEVIRFTAARGDYGPGDVEETVAERLAQARRAEGFDYRFGLADGTVIDARHSPLPGGGFMRRFTDITERARVEEAQRAILDAIAFPLVVTRLSDGVLLAANRPAAAMFGFELSAAVGRTTAPDYYCERDDRARMVERLRADGRADAFETRLRTAGGGEAWALVSARAFRYQGEEAMLACINDLTERKRIEQELEAQWSRSHAVLEGLAQGVMAFDGEERLIAWNRRVLDLLEIDHGFVYFHQPLEEITRHVAARGDYGTGDLEEVVRRRLEFVRGPLPRQAERVRPDGLMMETWTRALPDGGLVTTYTDVTDRKRSEQELAASRELFELAIRAARDGISQIDLRTGSIWFSPQWWSLLGYGEDEAVNSVERWSELILPEDREASKRLAADFAAGVIDDCQMVQRFRHKRGHVVFLYTRAIRVTDEQGRAVKLIGAHTDITERIRAEEAVRTAKEQAERALRELKEAQATLIQAEKMAALGSLVAGVAHEINTPVGIALTGASLLGERTAEIRRKFEGGQIRRADFADYLETASECSQLMLLNTDRAARLIQSFKQMAVDQASEERRAFDLRTYIDEVLCSLGVRLKRAAHTVEVDCPEDLVLDSYPGALSQVLTNLVMNSIIHGYAPDQRGTLRIAVSTPGEDEVELRYSDDGRGIPELLQDRVFEPFFTTNRASGGSGLGLNIVYNIATRTLRGRIRLDSAQGRGAAFTLRFPRVVPEVAAPVQAPPSLSPSA